MGERYPHQYFLPQLNPIPETPNDTALFKRMETKNLVEIRAQRGSQLNPWFHPSAKRCREELIAKSVEENNEEVVRRS